MTRTGRAAALVTSALIVLLLAAVPAHAARDQEATFQDDDLLVYANPDAVARTLDELDGLGVDRLRITLVWRAIAPGNDQDRKPEGFDAADPGDYNPGAWDRWDTVLRLGRERGMDVNFNVTTPAPDWATGSAERADIDETYEPDAREFGAFVRAAATRYDGAHGQPRVSYWSIQNEPNQPGWLTPQRVRRDGKWVEAAPRIYRDMVRTAWTALPETGHDGDTILVGATAPKACWPTAARRARSTRCASSAGSTASTTSTSCCAARRPRRGAARPPTRRPRSRATTRGSSAPPATRTIPTS